MKWLVEWSEAVLGARVRTVVPVSGGDISRAHRIELEDGRAVFAKWNTAAPAAMFTREVEGLEWLRETAAIAVPEVLACVEGLPTRNEASEGDAPSAATPHGRVSALLLEYLKPCPVTPRLWEDLGRRLAALHGSPASAFGALPSNFIGTLPQDNTPGGRWASFWIERRLEPQFRRAMNDPWVAERWSKALPKLYQSVREVLVEPNTPERIHGDLWSGNCVFCEKRGPTLIDPAAYAGHGEVDLAMMQLFGGFDERVHRAYLEVRGEIAGWDERQKLYQLYPLLVHVNLFGGSYIGAVDAIVRRFC